MGLITVNLKTAEMDCANTLLDPLDEVGLNFWNRVVENGAVAYYQPHIMISENRHNVPLYTSQAKSFWGCIPPSNPACTSSYDEKARIGISFELGVSMGYCLVNLYGGTDPTSMTKIVGLNYSVSGTYEEVLVSELDVPYYDTPTGSANPYYVEARFTSNTAITYLKHLDVYYQKWVNPIMPYAGEATLEWNTTSGWRGTAAGTEGDGDPISFIYTGSNTSTHTINTTTYPSTLEYVKFGALAGIPGGLYTNYAGDNWAPSDNMQFTQFSCITRYFVGTADQGTLVTEYEGFFKGAGADNRLYLSLWNDSGTTKGNIAGNMLTVGAVGTTFELGSWCASGTEGWFPVTLLGILDNDQGTNYLTFNFSLSAYGAGNPSVSVDITDYGAELWDVFKINYITEHVDCNIGVSVAVAEWTL